MQPTVVHRVMKILSRESKNWRTPAVTQISLRKNPFHVLISTLLSLRTKDGVTLAASERLFKLAETPQEMLRLSEKKIREREVLDDFGKFKKGRRR